MWKVSNSSFDVVVSSAILGSTGGVAPSRKNPFMSSFQILYQILSNIERRYVGMQNDHVRWMEELQKVGDAIKQL